MNKYSHDFLLFQIILKSTSHLLSFASPLTNYILILNSAPLFFQRLAFNISSNHLLHRTTNLTKLAKTKSLIISANWSNFAIFFELNSEAQKLLFDGSVG